MRRKREINRKDYRVLETELEYQAQRGKVTVEDKGEILSSYEVKKPVNIVEVLLIVGAILMGLGVLSFIAGNWSKMGRIIKYGIILLITGGLNYTSYIMWDKHRVKARSLLYAGVLSYGAGIFLIATMFNYSIDTPALFLVWMLGILPLGYHFKDKIIMSFTQILFLVYLFEAYSGIGKFPVLPLIMLGVFVYMNRTRINIPSFEVQNMILFILLQIYVYDYIGLELVYQTLLLFITGVVFNSVNNAKYEREYNVMGKIMYGILGIYLTFDSVWNYMKYIYVEEMLERSWSTDLTVFMYIFIILFIVYLLKQIKDGSLYGVVVLCGVILRFYIDLTYDFMPKSLFFIIGGLILIGFGNFFERQRKTQKAGVIEGVDSNDGR